MAHHFGQPDSTFGSAPTSFSRWKGSFAYATYDATLADPLSMREHVLPAILNTTFMTASTLRVLQRWFLATDLQLYAAILVCVTQERFTKQQCADAMKDKGMENVFDVLLQKPMDCAPYSERGRRSLVEMFRSKANAAKLKYLTISQPPVPTTSAVSGTVLSDRSTSTQSSQSSAGAESDALEQLTSSTQASTISEAASHASLVQEQPGSLELDAIVDDAASQPQLDLGPAVAIDASPESDESMSLAASSSPLHCESSAVVGSTLYGHSVPMIAQLWLEDDAEDVEVLPSQQQGGLALVGRGHLKSEQMILAGEKRISLRPCFWKQTLVTDPDRMRMFIREARVLELIGRQPSYHTPIIFGPAYRRIQEPGRDWYITTQVTAMEDIHGCKLSDLISSDSPALLLTQTERLKIARQLVEGVQHLQKLSITHRDLTPHNVMVCSTKIFENRRADECHWEGADPQRCLLADGYTPPNWNSESDLTELRPPAGTAGFRVVIIDFNTSLLIDRASCTRGLAAALTFKAGLDEYQASTWRGNKSISGSGQEYDFWREFDLFGLAMTIADVMRGRLCPETEHHKEMLPSWQSYRHQRGQEGGDHPSVLEWLLESCQLDDAAEGGSQKLEEKCFNEHNQQLVEWLTGLPTLRSALIEMTRVTRTRGESDSRQIISTLATSLCAALQLGG